MSPNQSDQKKCVHCANSIIIYIWSTQVEGLIIMLQPYSEVRAKNAITLHTIPRVILTGHSHMISYAFCDSYSRGNYSRNTFSHLRSTTRHVQKPETRLGVALAAK